MLPHATPGKPRKPTPFAIFALLVALFAGAVVGVSSGEGVFAQGARAEAALELRRETLFVPRVERTSRIR